MKALMFTFMFVSSLCIDAFSYEGSDENVLTQTSNGKSKESEILGYIVAYKSIFQTKNKDNELKSEAMKYAEESTISSRMKTFESYLRSNPMMGNSNNEDLTLFKDFLRRAKNYLVVESYIEKVFTINLTTKTSDFLAQKKDLKYGPLMRDTTNTFSRETLLKEVFAKDFDELEKIKKNHEIFNQHFSELEKDFHSKLNSYIHLVLQNLAREDGTRWILVSAAYDNIDESLNRIRSLLGSDLVTKKELSDSKLKKILHKIL